MISTTKKYAPVSYRRHEDDKVATMLDASSDSEGSSVQRRTAVFEKLAEPPQGPKKIAIKKGWMADMNANQGSKYGKKIVGFSSLPPKRTLAELP